MDKGDRKIMQGFSFDPGYIDFEHGIRVGHLWPEQRITRILKTLLTERHQVEMVCDRWGRGVYWQWICWVPRPNRDAKPKSSGHNFASGKFFISVDRDDLVFQAGLQIERAPKPGRGAGDIELAADWDWPVLLRQLKASELPRRIKRLLREGFLVRAGAFDSLLEYNRASWDPQQCLNRLRRFAPAKWGGFQLFWAFPQLELKQYSGTELITAIMAVFDEVTPVMDMCMYSPCLKMEKTALKSSVSRG